MVKQLRALVMECLPSATEKGYYGAGVPFYTHHRMICFIWPASVSLGQQKNQEEKKSSVSLGFCQGNLMSNEDGKLLAEGRKQVYVMHFGSLKDINEENVKALLFEAGMIDDMFSKESGNKKRKTK